MFMECFFEAQASITEELKESIKSREWRIYIDDLKTAPGVAHEKYFVEKFIDAGLKLDELNVYKNIFSEDEKKLLIKCSTKVRCVKLYHHPVKIDGWSPSYKIEVVRINVYHLVSKNEFEGFVLPWIRVAEELTLNLHEKTHFIKDIYKWLSGLNFKSLVIEYRGKKFHDIKKLKKFK